MKHSGFIKRSQFITQNNGFLQKNKMDDFWRVMVWKRQPLTKILVHNILKILIGHRFFVHLNINDMPTMFQF